MDYFFNETFVYKVWLELQRVNDSGESEIITYDITRDTFRSEISLVRLKYMSYIENTCTYLKCFHFKNFFQMFIPLFVYCWISINSLVLVNHRII